MGKNKSKLALFAVLILTLCFAVFIISGLLGNRNTVAMFDGILTRPIKASDEYSSVLNAENILQSDVSFPFDIKNKLSEKKFKKEFYSLIYSDIHEIQNSVLYGENGCYLSAVYRLSALKLVRRLMKCNALFLQKTLKKRVQYILTIREIL